MKPIQEQYMNRFLKKTQETYDFLMSLGKKEEAKQILRTGSVMSELFITIMKLPHHQFSCKEHGHELKGLKEQRDYIEKGICFWCERIPLEESL